MPRLIQCPGSLRLSQQVTTPASGSSIHAATGTVAHKLAEDAIEQRFDPGREIGTVVEIEGRDVEVNAAMAEGVQVYVDEVRRRFTGAFVSGLEAQLCLDDYWPASERPSVSAFGTTDAWAYHRDREHVDVIDYKNGVLYVDATSPQLFYYAAGMLLQMKWAGMPVRTVDLTVVQPNIQGVEKIRTHRVAAVDVLMWVEDVLKPTIEEAQRDDARIVSGTHCRFCPAKLGCPALVEARQAAARRDFANPHNGLVVYDDAELAEALDQIPNLELQIEALRAEGVRRGGVPGWRVAPTRPTRTWTVDRETLVRALCVVSPLSGNPSTVFDISRALDEATKLRSPAAVERALPASAWALVERYVQSQSSGVRLVRDTADPVGETSARNTAQDDFA